MRAILLISCITLYSLQAFSQAGDWTWVSGDSTANNYGIYGTKGMAVAGNQPGGRIESQCWTDLQGNLWLYGGIGYPASGSETWLDDLWEYNTGTGEWTWINGDSAGIQLPVFGTKGIATVANTPGARFYSMGWTDLQGNLWLFGGYGAGGAFGGFMNDLWKYDIVNNEWTWMSGDTTVFTASVFGSKGVQAPGNMPGQRKSSLTWTDLNGNLWLMGGDHYDPNAGIYYWLDDLWRYNIGANEWTWVSGDSSFNSVSHFGAKGVAASANKPGSRSCAVSWTDAQGNLWLFGGRTLTPQTTQTIARINDLWKYDIGANLWTWEGGDTTQGSLGIYGTRGVPAPGNRPGIRENATGFTDRSGNLWLFGGYGFPDIGATGWLNDLWKFTIASGEWAWVSGDTVFGINPVYGAKDVAAAANKPGARSYALGWVDLSDNFWLFGGQGNGGGATFGDMGDLWGFPVPGNATPPVAAFSASVNTICAGNTVTFTDHSTGSLDSRSWTFTAGTPDTSTGQNPTIMYNTPGTFAVKLVVSNSGGADSLIKAAYIAVFPSPVPVVTTSDSLICSGDSTQVCTSGNFISYLWNTNDTTHCTAANAAGGYWVTVTDANGCSAVSNHQLISVYPVPSVSIDVQGDTLTSFNSNSYQWFFNDTIKIPSATGNVYIAKQTGNYAVQVTDSNGCRALSNNVFVTVTGITEVDGNSLLDIYPDPFTNTIFIRMNGGNIGIGSIVVYNVLGEIVLFKRAVNFNSGPQPVDVSALSPGVFCFMIEVGNMTYLKKMIKE